MKSKRAKVLGLLLSLPLLAALGCGSGSSGGSSVSGGSCGGLGSSGLSGTADLAVGDNLNSVLALYFDVLANTDTNGSAGGVQPAADVILDNAGSNINDPRVTLLVSNAVSGNDLYVGDFGVGGVLIFRDYLSLTDGAAPDVTLNGTADISVPADLLVTANDQLVVADGTALTGCCTSYTTSAEDEVIVFADASAISADVAPDLLLDNATSLVDNPISVFVAENEAGDRNDLFVAMNANTSGGPLLNVYEDLDTLVTNGVTVAPDASLNEDTSFFDTGASGIKTRVYNNVLYVGVESVSSGSSIGTEVYVFNGADALATDQLPDAVLFGNDSFIDWPSTLANSTTSSGTDLLWVGDLNYDIGVCTDSPGLAIFSNPAAAVTGDGADVGLQQDTSNLGFATHMDFAGNALFVSGSRENCDLTATDVIIYRNATSGLCADSAPNIIIQGTATEPSGFGEYGEVAQPRGMAVIERDLGT